MTDQPRHGQRWALFALIPSAAWLTLFFLVPLGIVGAISVMQAGEPVTWRFDGSSFVRLVDPLHLNIMARSVALAVAATFLCFLLGYPLACYIVRRPPATRRLLYFLVLLPLWANSLILIYAWMVLLRPNGVVEQILTAVGLIGEEPLSLLYTPGAVMLGLVYWYLPFMVYPLYASIEKFDFHLLDAAYDLGASRWQAFRKVLLPVTTPGVVTGSLLVFIESLGAFVVPELLGGSKSMMIGNLVQQRFLSTPQDWPLGAAAALALLILIGGAMLLYLRYGESKRDAR